jgi:hypothetical protein
LAERVGFEPTTPLIWDHRAKRLRLVNELIAERNEYLRM